MPRSSIEHGAAGSNKGNGYLRQAPELRDFFGSHVCSANSATGSPLPRRKAIGWLDSRSGKPNSGVPADDGPQS